MERVVKGVKFTIDDSKAGPAFFVLGIRKSGSSMFNRVCKLLSKYNEYNFIDVAGSMFSNNINSGMWVNDTALNDIVVGGNVYGGFRNYPASISDNPVFRDGKKALLVRDPRDALVSEYFQTRIRILFPEKKLAEAGARENILRQREAALKQDINEYVRGRADLMRRTLSDYENLLSDTNTRMFRYEDIIFNKKELIDVLAQHFRWTCKPKQLEAILGWVDVKPVTENPRQFIRKVTPGDHLEKLDSATIGFLNEKFADALKTFGY